MSSNVPGNYGAEPLISTVANPTPSDFLIRGALARSLNAADNTLYFWGDGHATNGGSATIGLNLFLNGGGANSPTISTCTVPGTGQTPTLPMWSANFRMDPPLIEPRTRVPKRSPQTSI